MLLVRLQAVWSRLVSWDARQAAWELCAARQVDHAVHEARCPQGTRLPPGAQSCRTADGHSRQQTHHVSKGGQTASFSATKRAVI